MPYVPQCLTAGGLFPTGFVGQAPVLFLILCLMCGPLEAYAENSSVKEFDLPIVQQQLNLPDSVIRVNQGDQVHLNWTVDEVINIHLHGYDIEQTLSPDPAATMSFKAYATGRFPISIHQSHDRRGHHSSPLLYLEVLPR